MYVDTKEHFALKFLIIRNNNVLRMDNFLQQFHNRLSITRYQIGNFLLRKLNQKIFL